MSVTFGLEKECYVLVIFLSVGKATDKGYASYGLFVDRIAQWK